MFFRSLLPERERERESSEPLVIPKKSNAKELKGLYIYLVANKDLLDEMSMQHWPKNIETSIREPV
jgi:hypothetical protein